MSASSGGAVPGLHLVAVASWDVDAETTHPADFRLVHNTFVTMFWRTSLLEETAGWLGSHGCDVAGFDAGTWASAGDMLDDLAERLQFPGYFGRNLDALNDCIADVASREYGWHSDATGLLIVLNPSTPSQPSTGEPLRPCSTLLLTRPGAPSSSATASSARRARCDRAVDAGAVIMQWNAAAADGGHRPDGIGCGLVSAGRAPAECVPTSRGGPTTCLVTGTSTAWLQDGRSAN